MRSLRILSFSLCVLAFAGSPVAGQDVTGRWILSVELSAGSGDATFVLQQHGDSLSGTYSGVLGQGVRVSGKIQGDEVEFSFDSEAGTITYEGKVSGTTMKGTCDYGALGPGTFEGRKVENG